jgi:hypothetical protein
VLITYIYYKQHLDRMCMDMQHAKIQKGLDDKEKAKEGPMYVPGGFDCEPGPSKRARATW